MDQSSYVDSCSENDPDVQFYVDNQSDSKRKTSYYSEVENSRISRQSNTLEDFRKYPAGSSRSDPSSGYSCNKCLLL